MKSFTHPPNDKIKKFKVAQEAERKDLEKAFGSLKSRWGII